MTRLSEQAAQAAPGSEVLQRLIGRAVAAEPPRAGSLIITVFGDAISQHGNSVWLGSLIDCLEPFGLNARQIRTAVFRLVKDDWLTSRQIGRRSYYAFTEFGRRQYEKAATRIYTREFDPWDGRWTLVLPTLVDTKARELLRRELGWLGFGQLASGVLAHPNANIASLRDTINELGLTEQVVVLNAQSADPASSAVLQSITHSRWNLDRLDRRFQSFIDMFAPGLHDIRGRSVNDPRQMFSFRTLVIHQYRRILLKMTDLPNELLPSDWSGTVARRLVSEIYFAARDASMVYLTTAFECPAGCLPEADPGFYRRYQPSLSELG